MSSNPASLVAFADGIWICAAPVRFLGLRLTSTMTVLRLSDGGLLLTSPVAMTPERRLAVEALGRVAHLYAPNLFHHRWLGEWSAAFPTARVHAPRGLEKKVPGLRIDRFHGEGPDPALADTVQEIPIAGFRVLETALVHSPARTAIVADLVHNVGRPTHTWTRLYTQAMGFHDRIALSRVLRWTAFPDRKAARGSIDDLLARPFDRLIVGHGAPLLAGGHEALAKAYAWLRR
jgi:hypothetical protein